MTGFKGQTRCSTHVPCLPRLAEQSTAPDRLQPPLLRRFGFRRQVSASVRLRIERKSRLPRDIESSLYQALIDSRFSFMKRGVRTIEEIYNSVKTLYPDLCDDSYYCSENCRKGNNQPEWNHTVRSALNILRSANASIRHSGHQLGLQ